MRDDQVALLVIGIAAAVTIFIVIAVNRSTTSIRESLRRLTAAAGWTDLRNVFLAAAGVKGTWRSFPVALSFHPRQKGVPQRLILKIRAQTDARLIVKRRFNGFFSNRPLTWFGPRLLDLQQAAATNLWVRGDEPTIAERLFGDDELAKLVNENLVARYDEVAIDRKGLRITRALDERLVKQKYGMPTFEMRLNPAKFEPIAREELALAECLVNKLSMLA